MKIVNKILVLLLLLLGKISSLLSIKARTRFGSLFGIVLSKLSKKRFRITFDNLNNAFPDKDDVWLNKTALASYKNLGITLIELLTMKYFTDKDFKSYIKYENIELINKLRERGNGLLLISGHYGNWELLAYTAGLFSGNSVLIVVKPQKNQFADDYLNQYRTKGGNEVVKMHKAARPMVNRFRSEGVVAMLADQSATSHKDLFVDFFGRPAATYEAPAQLALKFKVPIIYGFSIRNEDGTYSVKLNELDYSDLDFDEYGVRELTKRHVKVLEEAIRKRPDLWAWQHKRWKYTDRAPKNYA